MSASPLYGERPSMQGSFRRSFTLPARQLSVHEKAGLEKTDANAEVLYSHPSARIVSFSPPKESIKSTSKAEVPADTDYPIDTVETLPWRSRTESLIATGALKIEKVRGSTNFLKCQDVMRAVLRNSQCWCVDGESKFVLRVRKFQYYRIELPSTSDEDKAKVEEMKKVLPTVLRFERTPCPFVRSFTVDLPEDAITPRRKGAWTRRDSSLSNTPDTETPPLRRRQPERSWSTKAPPTSYPKNAPGSAGEGERGRAGGPAGLYRRASLFENYRSSSPASLGLSEDGTDSDHHGSEHDSEMENMTDRSETSSPHKHLERPKRRDRVMSEVSTSSKEHYSTFDTTTEAKSQVDLQKGLPESAIPEVDSQGQVQAIDSEKKTLANVIDRSATASTTSGHDDSPTAEIGSGTAITTQDHNSAFESVAALSHRADGQLSEARSETGGVEELIGAIGAVAKQPLHTSPDQEERRDRLLATDQVTMESSREINQAALESETEAEIESGIPTNEQILVQQPLQPNLPEKAPEGPRKSSSYVQALQLHSVLDTDVPETTQSEKGTDRYQSTPVLKPGEESVSASGLSKSDPEQQADSGLELKKDPLQEQASGQLGIPGFLESIDSTPESYSEHDVKQTAYYSAERLGGDEQGVSAIAEFGPRTPELRSVHIALGAEDNEVEGELSPVSSVDSFHTIASTMHRLSSSDESDAENTPIARRRIPFPNAASRHRRDISEITVTASSGSEPSSPEHKRASKQERERNRTPSNFRFPEPDASPLEHTTLSSAVHEQDGVRERFKSRQRSFSPLPPASTIFTGNQIRHGSGRGHMTKAILQKVVVKPIEVAIMAVHILARIANGATVSDLLSGELFKRPESQGRISGLTDQLNGSKSGSETEDDYGVPIRGRRRSSERRLAMAMDDEVDHHFEDVD